MLKEQAFYIINLEHLIIEYLSLNLKKEGADIDEKIVYEIKLLGYICIILSLLTLLVLVIKKYPLICLDRVSTLL